MSESEYFDNVDEPKHSPKKEAFGIVCSMTIG